MMFLCAILTVVATVVVYVLGSAQDASVAALFGGFVTIGIWYAQNSWAYWSLQAEGLPHSALSIGALAKGQGKPPVLSGVVWVQPILHGFEVCITLPFGGSPIPLGAFATEEKAISAATRYVFGKGIQDWHIYAHNNVCSGRTGFCIAIRSDAATFVLVDPRTGEYWNVAYQTQQNLLNQPTAEPENFLLSTFGDLSLSPDF